MKVLQNVSRPRLQELLDRTRNERSVLVPAHELHRMITEISKRRATMAKWRKEDEGE